MLDNFVIGMLSRIVNQKQGRKILARQLDKYIYKSFVTDCPDTLPAVQEKKYQYLSAILHTAVKNIDRGYISKKVIKNLIEVFVKNAIMQNNNENLQSEANFREKYGIDPPAFLVLSPTQRCNLSCIGCYASSTAETATYLPYPIVEKILRENHDVFGSRFMTISGGEPFMYRDRQTGQTLLDLFEEFNDTFFLVYTNGTLITKKVAKRLEDLGNVTPAISVEGYEEQTDERRGKGVYKRILHTMENLREAGVPFGISITSTSKNADILLTDEFYDYYFEELGVSYMWQFQLMPIGRADDLLTLMVQPEQRIQLFEKWEYMLEEKKYPLADFWNSGVLSNGCIAYGRAGGYLYIDWNGNIMPCVFVPYYVDNVYDLYNNGKTISDALFSKFMINGRKWQDEYGYAHRDHPDNWLLPCSIRDHYENFRRSILTEDAKPEDDAAGKILHDEKYFKTLSDYDKKLEKLTLPIWRKEYLGWAAKDEEGRPEEKKEEVLEAL